MEFDKSLNDLTPLELVELAEKWQDKKEERSVIAIAKEDEDGSQVVSGGMKDLVVMLAAFMQEDPKIAEPAIALYKLGKIKHFGRDEDKHNAKN